VLHKSNIWAQSNSCLKKKNTKSFGDFIFYYFLSFSHPKPILFIGCQS
jgi:hypothetical protein